MIAVVVPVALGAAPAGQPWQGPLAALSSSSDPDLAAGAKDDRERQKAREGEQAKQERRVSRQRLRGASRQDALSAGQESFPQE